MKTRLAFAAGLLGLIVFWWRPVTSQQPDLETRIDQTVREFGTVVSASTINVASELAGDATILWVIEDGARVKKGDRLVEFDASTIEDQHRQARLEFQLAEAQINQAEANVRAARTNATQFEKFHELRVKVAELNQKKNIGENGAMAVSLRNLKRDIELSEKRAKLVEAIIARRKLASDGPPLEELMLEQEKTQTELAKANDKLELLTKHEHPYQSAVLELAVMQAKSEALKQKQESEARIQQAQAALAAAEMAHVEAESQFQNIESQLKNTQITAPADGIVLHENTATRRTAASNAIEAGATVRERQSILKIVDDRQLQLRVEVHESRIRRVKKGQTAKIRFDGIPGKVFKGKVLSIGDTPEPVSWFGSGVKKYAVTVSIDGPIDRLKLGQSAAVEIDAP